MTKKRHFFHAWVWPIILAFIVAGWLVWIFKLAPNLPAAITLEAKPNFWGVTYSKRFASFLDLNWRDTYLAIIDDLGVKNIRLPLYWQDLEPTEGAYDFSDYDWMIKEGAKRKVHFILAVGRRLPRWPECHTPDWSGKYPEEVIRQKLTKLLATVVEHYRYQSNVVAWQVENEPLLDSFGLCPPSDVNWLKEEIDLVRKLDDSRPVVVTASGELSSWQTESGLADVLGTTLYRVVWGPLTGYVRWPIPAWFYTAKLASISRLTTQAIIAELQAEPWAPNSSLDNLPTSESDKSFTLQQFRGNLQYAINTDFSQAYLWGVEWWYLEKTRGRGEFWAEAKKLKW